jgi:hypothetical protein
MYLVLKGDFVKMYYFAIVFPMAFR